MKDDYQTTVSEIAADAIAYVADEYGGTIDHHYCELDDYVRETVDTYVIYTSDCLDILSESSHRYAIDDYGDLSEHHSLDCALTAAAYYAMIADVRAAIDREVSQ